MGGMKDVNVGIIGMGRVGSGAATVLHENADQIALKLGFRLNVTAVCALDPTCPVSDHVPGDALRTTDWREVVNHPNVDIVVELASRTTLAREIVYAAIEHGKSVVTANQELIAHCGSELWELANRAGVDLAMDAEVCGGISSQAVLREGIAGDRITALYGILNGASNFILTEIEKRGDSMAQVLADAERLGYAEANPSADVDGYDACSKLAILATLAFGQRITPADIYVEGIRRISPIDFQYAHVLDHTIRLLCAARQTADGLILSVRPTLIPRSTFLAGVHGSSNAIWVKDHYGDDAFYYGRGSGSRSSGVAVVSDLMRVAREFRSGRPERVSPYAHARLGECRPASVTVQERPYYLRFRVNDRPGIIATLAGILAGKHISLDAMPRKACDTKGGLPLVITVDSTSEQAVRDAVQEMSHLEFLKEAPLALPIEPSP